MTFFITGCETLKIKKEVQKVSVPILYCPAPPKIERPKLPIHQMTKEDLQKDGEVAKRYKATVKALIGYAKELESSLNEYNEINKAYEEKRKEIEKDLNKGNK